MLKSLSEMKELQLILVLLVGLGVSIDVPGMSFLSFFLVFFFSCNSPLRPFFDWAIIITVYGDSILNFDLLIQINV